MSDFIHTIVRWGWLTGCLLSLQATAQTTEPSERAKKYYEQAQVFFSERRFEQGISALKSAIEKSPDYAEAHFRLGSVYELNGETELAMSAYQKAISLKPSYVPFINGYYSLGMYYLQKGSYTQAKPYFEQFLDLKPTRAYQVSQGKRMLATCVYALEALKKPLPFNSQPMGKNLNTFALQYFPVLTADGQTIIFTARFTPERQSDENLYISYRKGNEWTVPQSLSANINTANNEGTCSISADGRTIVFTSCQGRENYGSCDLFVSYRNGDEWTLPKNMGPKVNSMGWESQPSLSADGRTLYFASDRRGTRGKRDIWMSTLEKDGYWGMPANLGSTINTPEDDLSPFIHTNGRTLFFASEGHLGLGGFDLFFSEITAGRWTVPQNLGYPVNTFEDQVSLFVSSDGKEGYFSSEKREGRRNVSSILHEFVIPEQLALKYKSDYLKGTVYDARTKQKLETKIELYNIETNTLEAVTKSDRITGEYLTVLTEGAEYALYINKTGYLFKSLTFNYTEKKDYEPVVIDIYLEPIEKGAKEVLNNLFFPTGEYKLEEKSKTEIDKIISFLNEYPRVNLEISGHTDDVGTDEDNMSLSEKRARSVHEYLLKTGVNPLRVKFAGYGETRPFAPNTSDKNRQLNRRIEFKVLQK